MLIDLHRVFSNLDGLYVVFKCQTCRDGMWVVGLVQGWQQVGYLQNLPYKYLNPFKILVGYPQNLLYKYLNLFKILLPEHVLNSITKFNWKSKTCPIQNWYTAGYLNLSPCFRWPVQATMTQALEVDQREKRPCSYHTSTKTNLSKP